MKILFICLGNTGGSPLAMGILRKKLRDKNLDAIVDSAGFEAHLINERPDKLAVNIGKKHDIDIAQYRSRLFSVEDFDKYDRIYALDSHTYSYAVDFARNQDDADKVDYLMNVMGIRNNKDIPDILHRNLDESDEVFITLEKACDKIVNIIEQEKK